MIRSVLYLSLLAFFAAPAVAAPEPERIVGTLDDLRPRDEWFGVYMQGKKVGHARMFLAHEGEGEASRVVLAFEFRMKLTAMGRKTVVYMRQRTLFQGRAPWVCLPRTLIWKRSTAASIGPLRSAILPPGWPMPTCNPNTASGLLGSNSPSFSISSAPPSSPGGALSSAG